MYRLRDMCTMNVHGTNDPGGRYGLVQTDGFCLVAACCGFPGLSHGSGARIDLQGTRVGSDGTSAVGRVCGHGFDRFTQRGIENVGLNCLLRRYLVEFSAARQPLRQVAAIEA